MEVHGGTTSVVTVVALAAVMTTVWLNNVGEAVDVEEKWLPALHSNCLYCICVAATGCNSSHECTKGYCGPFGISHIYWVEAGMPVLAGDDPERVKAYEDCANHYTCAAKIVTAYMQKLAKDCNGDDLINCDDFVLMHGNGGYSCNISLNRTVRTRAFRKRYMTCRGSVGDDLPLGPPFELEESEDLSISK